MKKRALSLALALLMIVSILPLNIASALVMGDVDGSGEVKAADARLVLRASVGLENFTEEQIKLADVDFSGDIKAADARLVLRASVGLETLVDPHTHSYTSSVTKAPTCTEKGIKTFTCQCGDSYKEDVAALGHTPVTDKAVAPTCTKAGKTEGSHCSTCGIVITAQATVAAKGHTPVTDKAVAPTCTKAGKTAGSHCSVCGTVITAQATVAATGHVKSSLDKTTVKAATCKTDGYSGDEKCAVCKTTTKKGKTVKSQGTEHVLETRTVAPSCTQDGYTAKFCKICEYFDENSVTAGEKAKGHSFGKVATVKPTCTEQGYDLQTCSRCGSEVKSNYVTEKGHTYKWTTAKKATCKETGTRNGTCTVCGDKTTETIPLTACTSFIEVTETGNTTKLCKTFIECKTCGKVISETQAKHRMIGDGELVPAKCATPGSQNRKCFHCYHTDTLIQPALGHIAPYNEELSYSATCTTDGKYIYSGECTRPGCGEILDNEEVIIKAKGHNLTGMRTCTTDVTCTTCKQVIEERYGHDFTLNSTAYSAKINTFFCSRCGAKTDNALAAFNSTANKIKTTPFINYSSSKYGSNLLAYVSKSTIKTEYSRFDFGIYTNAIKSLYEEEMANNPDTLTPLYTNRTIRYSLPLNPNVVSELTKADIDGSDIKVEKLTSVKVSDILAEYPDTYAVGTKNYDLTPYKNKVINKDIIKVTIDVKNEKYSNVKNLSKNEKTALMKVMDLDIRLEAEEFRNPQTGELIMTESEKGDGYEITMRMQLREISSDATVTYYLLADTYEPIIAVYDRYEVMDQTIDMTFKFGLFNLNGELDPIVSTHEKEAYIFPALYTAA